MRWTLPFYRANLKTDANGPLPPFVADINRCGAARRNRLSPQL
jgi:hypothetical protein